MLLHSCTTISNASSSSQNSYWALSIPKKPQNLVSYKPIFFANPRRPTKPLRAQLSDQILEIVHNKVLVAAGVSAAIGQLSKPFTSVILYGKEFDIKATIQAGGFPSTHSSSVVAAATCLGLERGFADSIFGLTVVYAGLIMYDAQGVRREVGIHARTLNKVVESTSRPNFAPPTKEVDSFDCQLGTSPPTNHFPNDSGSLTSNSRNALLVSKVGKTEQMQFQSDVSEGLDRQKTPDYSLLKESIGHTEVEVIAGALLGFLVSLAVNTIL